MTAGLQVLRAGHATLQDLGRPGFAALGVPIGGAADQHAARTANTLVGNADGSPLVEITATDFAIRPDRDLLVAVTGAAGSVSVGGRSCPAWELLPVHAGQEVHVPAPTSGLRSYLAVNGDLRAPRTLGSVAPDALLDFTQRITDGTVLEVDGGLDELPTGSLLLFRLGVARPSYAVNGVSSVVVTEGPDAALLSGGDPWAGEFAVTPQSNEVGLRLEGPRPEFTSYAELLSRGVPVGAVEVPPSGGVIVLLRARLVTAGYPVVAVATTVAMDVLGQLRPGDALRFTPTTVEAAVAELRGREARHRALAERVRNALASRGLGSHLQPDHASIRQHHA